MSSAPVPAVLEQHKDPPSNIATAIAEVSERASILVREEIELAKAEITEKGVKLARARSSASSRASSSRWRCCSCSIGFAWLLYYVLPGNDFTYFWGFFAMALILVILGVIAGPDRREGRQKQARRRCPTMAIDEARKIREDLTPSRRRRPLHITRRGDELSASASAAAAAAVRALDHAAGCRERPRLSRRRRVHHLQRTREERPDGPAHVRGNPQFDRHPARRARLVRRTPARRGRAHDRLARPRRAPPQPDTMGAAAVVGTDRGAQPPPPPAKAPRADQASSARGDAADARRRPGPV